MTSTALAEFANVVRNIAGPNEKASAVSLLQRVRIVPDNPSSRALGIRPTGGIGANDIIIFGTGDSMGAVTMTADARAIRSAAAQGVNFAHFLHRTMPLQGR